MRALIATFLVLATPAIADPTGLRPATDQEIARRFVGHAVSEVELVDVGHGPKLLTITAGGPLIFCPRGVLIRNPDRVPGVRGAYAIANHRIQAHDVRGWSRALYIFVDPQGGFHFGADAEGRETARATFWPDTWAKCS